MEHIFNLIDMHSTNSRIKVSITESTMMQIVHSAMDKAYRKVRSKSGVLERLNEISKFYELSVMQLEGCLKFVQEETDICVLESCHQVLLEDLTEIRDRLQGRLKEVELAISEKDKELLERLANELKLRKALEMNEKELDSLHADLKLEKRKSEGIEEFILSSQANTDGDREGEFCELKSSVDQQVWNIQQQLEPSYQLRDEERSQGIDNRKIEQMGSDISILKETLDVAFCKMQNAIFLSELGPIEHQWTWDIERGAAAIVIKGSLKDFQENFEEEVKKREMQVSVGLRKHLSSVMREMTCLGHELELFSNQDEVQVKNSKAKDSLKAKGRCLSEGHSFNNSSNFLLKVGEASTTGQPCEEDSENDSGHYVAKMIKNHESIIQRKNAELNSLKREILREKGFASFRTEKGSVNPKRRIQEVIMSLESLINWNPWLGDIFGDCTCDNEVETLPEVRLSTGDQLGIEKSGIESMEEVWANVKKTLVSHLGNKEPCTEVRMMNQELKDANLQTVMMEEIYLTLFKSLVEEFHIEMLNHHLQCLVKEGMYERFIEEMKNEWNEKTGSDRIEVQSKKEKYNSLLKKAVKDLGSSHNFRAACYQNAKAESNCFEDQNFSGLGNLEDMLKEDIYIFLLQEILWEWNENIESYKSKSSLREGIFFIVLGETVRDIMNTANYALGKLTEFKIHDSFNYDFQFSNKFFESAAMSIKDDVWKVFLAEMLKEWKMKIDAFSTESLIREEVLQFVVSKAVKEACIIEVADDQNQERSSNNSLPVNKLWTSLEESARENLTQTLDRLVKFLEEEKTLILSAYFEMKEQKMRLDLVGSVFEEFDGHEHFQGIFTNEQNGTKSAYSKLEKALQHLELGKALLSELGSRIDITVGNLEWLHNEMTPLVDTTHCKKPSIYQAKDVEEEKISIYESFLTPILELSQILKGFECSSRTRLGRHILRLEEMKHQLDLLVKCTASLSQKESLYKKAFIRRCENLQMAETEVDLLGDQVDLLLGLLEKIYVTLHRHSPVLQQFFEVSEMLKVIEKEVGGRK
ncbi:WPP domain-associated protein [Herrania umbratica]|uniref:WPP domain-associated protein n=1 Tax=Herrania umbratica TaxID=108875 RepID=A0A6J1B9I3_9ROSI|nr:WPP domain-associated protein [Herrania umbratica]